MTLLPYTKIRCHQVTKANKKEITNQLAPIQLFKVIIIVPLASSGTKLLDLPFRTEASPIKSTHYMNFFTKTRINNDEYHSKSRSNKARAFVDGTSIFCENLGGFCPFFFLVYLNSRSREQNPKERSPGETHRNSSIIPIYQLQP